MMSACVRLGRPSIIVRIEEHYYCSDNYHNCRIGKINSLGCSGQPISNNAHLMEESTAPMMEYCILFLDPLRIVWLHGAWQCWKTQKKSLAGQRSGQQIQLLCHTQCIAMHNTETTYHEIINDTVSGLPQLVNGSFTEIFFFTRSI